MTPPCGPDDGVEAERLRQQIDELRSTLAAIRAGDVDAVVMGGPQGEQLYTLVSADRPYRVIVEQMGEGAITVSERGIVLYANRRASELLARPRPELLGHDVDQAVSPRSRPTLTRLLTAAAGTTVSAELELARPDGGGVYVLASVTALEFEGVLVRCLVLTDLTARRRDEKALSDAYAEITISARELEEAQRIGRIGNWYWDAATDRVTWSSQMYQIFGLEQPADELTFSAALAAVAHPEDAPRVAAARERALVDHQPFTVPQRVIHHGGEIRHIITRGEVIVDADGVVTGMRGTAQDVTDVERAAAEMLAAREELWRQSLQLATEHRIKESLQRAVLPVRLPDVTGAVLAARYLPADELARVGGDWYDAFCLPDQTLAVAVGDVVGHDLESAATMGQMRNALRAYAYEARPPSVTLTRLNHLVNGLDDAGLATVVHARIAPGRQTVEWASAGHPPPLLVTDDGARLLAAPISAMLGVVPGETYRDTTVSLRPGDLLVLFTDGLVERRDRDLDAGLAQLLRAAGELKGKAPDDVCDGLVERLLSEGHEDDVCLLAIQLT